MPELDGTTGVEADRVRRAADRLLEMSASSLPCEPALQTTLIDPMDQLQGMRVVVVDDETSLNTSPALKAYIAKKGTIVSVLKPWGSGYNVRFADGAVIRLPPHLLSVVSTVGGPGREDGDIRRTSYNWTRSLRSRGSSMTRPSSAPRSRPTSSGTRSIGRMSASRPRSRSGSERQLLVHRGSAGSLPPLSGLSGRPGSAGRSGRVGSAAGSRPGSSYSRPMSAGRRRPRSGGASRPGSALSTKRSHLSEEVSLPDIDK